MNVNWLAMAASGVAVKAAVICFGASGSAAVPIRVTRTDGEPDLVEDFSTYRSTTELLSDPRGIYSRGEDIYDNTSLPGGSSINGFRAAGTIQLDSTDGWGALSQSMKYTFSNCSLPSGGGGITRWINWADNAEIWIEVYKKFSPNFTISNGFSGGAAYKDFFIIGSTNGVGHGIATGFENGDGGNFTVYYEDGGGTSGTYHLDRHYDMSVLADGRYHRYRQHIDTKRRIREVWIDDDLIVTLTDWVPYRDHTTGAIMGQNINMCPVAKAPEQSINWGSIKVWYTGNDPGW